MLNMFFVIFPCIFCVTVSMQSLIKLVIEAMIFYEALSASWTQAFHSEICGTTSHNTLVSEEHKLCMNKYVWKTGPGVCYLYPLEQFVIV